MRDGREDGTDYAELGESLALAGVAMASIIGEQPVSEEGRQVSELLMEYNRRMFEQILENLERQMKEEHDAN